MNGAESLIRTAIAAGVEVCFANPGTTEMPLVAALDSADGLRPILGLFEGVCTGAADGYGRMAEKHWREFRPNMVKQMEATGELQEMLYEAQEKTKDEMATLRLELIKQGKTAEQAHHQAWEMVRENYILLPAES